MDTRRCAGEEDVLPLLVGLAAVRRKGVARGGDGRGETGEEGGTVDGCKLLVLLHFLSFLLSFLQSTFLVTWDLLRRFTLLTS
jgi:hypothetical protein